MVQEEQEKLILYIQLIRNLLNKGIERNRLLYINFEDYRLSEINYKEFGELVENYYEMFPENMNKKVWFFFDEIQNVERWEKVIRFLPDRYDAEIFVTGSSSKLLSKEISTELRGRVLSYEVLPFSFREFLKVKNFEVKASPPSYERKKILKLLDEYLRFGGYPEVVLEKEKVKILREIWEVTIARDLIERWNIRNIKALKLMILSLQNSKEFSIFKFYKYLKSCGIDVSKNTLYQYLEYLRDAFIVFPLRKYDPSYKNIEKSIPKIFLVDTGLYLENWELSMALENTVFMDLKRKGLIENENIFHYFTKNNREIDFLIKEKTK